jgi:DNA-binding ferritin-like protein
MPTTETSETDETTALRKTDHGEPWRPQQMIEENPIGLDEDATEELIPKLDEIQCTLWTLYHQYQKHHWLVEGPQFPDLHDFFEENYTEVHKYVDRVAERITALGGIPTSRPENFSELSRVDHEPEGTYRLRSMLEHDLDGERVLSTVVRKTIDVALEHGDHGTKRELEKVLTKSEDRAHHIDHLLGDDTLELGLTTNKTLQS